MLVPTPTCLPYLPCLLHSLLHCYTAWFQNPFLLPPTFLFSSPSSLSIPPSSLSLFMSPHRWSSSHLDFLLSKQWLLQCVCVCVCARTHNVFRPFRSVTSTSPPPFHPAAHLPLLSSFPPLILLLLLVSSLHLSFPDSLSPATPHCISERTASSSMHTSTAYFITIHGQSTVYS